MLVATGAANPAYASYSASLAARQRWPLRWVVARVAANAAWAAVCLALATFLGVTTWLGVGHLVAEAAVVGGLAALEWDRRRALSTDG